MQKNTLLLVLCMIVLSHSATAQISFKKVYGQLNKSDYSEALVSLDNGDFITCGTQIFQDADTGDYIGQGVLRRLSASGEELWSFNYSDPNATVQDLTFSDIKLSTDGHIMLTGNANYGYPDTYHNFFLAKIDIDGNLIWWQTYTQAHAQWAKEVIQTSDGGYLMVGHNNTDGAANSLSLQAIKTDAQGDIEWEYIQNNSSNDAIRHQAYAVIEDDNGNFYISASINQILHNGTDFYLVKLDALGNLLWDKIVDHDIGGEGRDVLLKSNGNILLCGWHAPNWIARPLVIELNTDGQVLAEHEINFDSNIKEWAYSFYLDELDELTMLSFHLDYYRITKVDKLFNLEWTHAVNFTGASSAEASGMIKTADGGYVCTGTSMVENDIEATLFKTNESGLVNTTMAPVLAPHIKLYPNPAKDFIQITKPITTELIAIQLYDTKGALVKTFEPKQQRLNISSLAMGTYFLHLKTSAGDVVEKVIK